MARCVTDILVAGVVDLNGLMLFVGSAVDAASTSSELFARWESVQSLRPVDALVVTEGLSQLKPGIACLDLTKGLSPIIKITEADLEETG